MNVLAFCKKLTAVLLAFLFFISSIRTVLADNSITVESSSSVKSSDIVTVPLVQNENALSINTAPAVSDDASSMVNPQLTDGKAAKDNGTGAIATNALTFTPTNTTYPVGFDPFVRKDVSLATIPESQQGALNYNYPIAVPPGRNNLQPNLQLNYNSSLGKLGAEFGYGWNINIPYIGRVNRNGSDNLYATSTINYFYSTISGEMVATATSTATSTYVGRVENGSFIKYTFKDNVWIGTDKQGVQYKYGLTSGSRNDDPNSSSKVYKWMLEEVRDPNDNYIKYQYYKDVGQIYPLTITYTGNGVADGIFQVNFLRESRPDIATSTEAGFNMVTKYRINEINTTVNAVWVNKYAMSYSTSTDTQVSVLTSIIQSGQDESGVTTTLPATSFLYQTSQKSLGITTAWTLPSISDYWGASFVTMGSLLPTGMQLVDVNGDGLPDFVYSGSEWDNTLSRSVYKQKIAINNGHGWTVDPSWVLPSLSSEVEASFIWQNGKDTGMRLIDVNGDGLVDFVYSGYEWDGVLGYTTYKQKIAINNGSGWTIDPTWILPSLSNYWGASFVQIGTQRATGMQLVDVNGDGLPDFVYSGYEWDYSESRTVFKQKIAINNGHGWTVDPSWVLPSLSYDVGASFYRMNGQDSGMRLVDVNGDGLVDFVFSGVDWIPDNNVSGYVQKVAINNGHGWTVDPSWVLPSLSTEWGASFVKSGSLQPTGVELSDINGDRLTDFVYSGREWDYTLNCEVYKQAIAINNGHGWVVDSNWVLPPLSYDVGSSFVKGNADTDTGMRFLDINGDGLTDFLFSGVDWDPNLSATVYRQSISLNQGDTPNLLKKITYPQGGAAIIAYKGSPTYVDGNNNILNPKLPLVLDTVFNITTNDGVATSSSVTYSYEGGKYYYANPYDRKPAGFALIKQTDLAGNLTKAYYHQGDSINSAQGEYADSMHKIGKIYRTELYDSAGGLYQKVINKWDSSDLGNGAKFVRLAQSIRSDYDGNTDHKDQAEDYKHDDTTGNLIQKVEWGEVVGSDNGTFSDTGSDKFTTDITYASSTSSSIISAIDDITVIDQNNNKVKETKYYYDSLSFGNVDKGNQTKEEDWKSGSTYINSQKTYNSYGLVMTITDPRSKQTDYSYDTYNLYPTTVTNPLSQQIQYQYDYSSGKVKQVTDPNNLIFQTVYDGLDRIREEKQPDLTSTSTLVTKLTISYTDTANAVSTHTTDYLDSATTVDSYTYFDGLNRKIQERKEAEDANTFTVKDYIYNNIGLLQKESLPYFSSGSFKTSPTINSNLYTTYAYDPLQRVTSATNAVGTTSNSYNNWKVTTTDPRGKTKDLYKDAYDNLIRVDEHNSTSTYSTYYTYDYLKGLTGITDALGNVRNFTYDGLGRRLTAQDLHASGDTSYGSWSYAYDDSGNLTQKIDPKNQIINYTYDDINRPLTEDYTGQVGTEVSYSYDACSYGVGHLCVATSTDAVIVDQYNPIGKVSSETKVINGVNYTTAYTYDRQNNTINITNPDNSQIKYDYNTAGLLDKVSRKESTDGSFSEVVSNFDYSPTEQVATSTYANGLVVASNYDATKLYRLSSQVATTASSTRVLDLAFTYDNNGNTTRIVDGSQNHRSKQIDYVFDDLNRLTSASSSLASFGGDYLRTFTYDALGNITNRSDQGSYLYDGNQGLSYANPHAVTSIGSTNYSYDNNGNVTNVSGGFTYMWDYNNRLTQASSTPTLVTYAYDANGQRVKYSNGTTITYYPEKTYNTDGTTPTKYIYAGNVLLATVTGTGASSTLHTIVTDNLTGSNVAINSAGTQVEELLEYYPYGDIRLDEKSGAFSEMHKFTGQEYDAGTGLYYYNARYQNPTTAKFISEDQAFLAIGDQGHLQQITNQTQQQYLADPQKLNSYSYARNNPLRYTDPTGQAFGLDDAAGFVVGGVIGTGVYLISSPFTGQKITWGGVGGSFTSGGIIGVGAVNTPETLGASDAIAIAAVVGGIGAGTGNVVKQGVDISTGQQQGGFNGKELGVNTTVGFISGGLTEGFVPDAEIPGLSSGRGNMNAVGNALQTKLENGTISGMSLSSAAKSTVGSQASDAYRTIGGAIFENYATPSYSTPTTLINTNSQKKK